VNRLGGVLFSERRAPYSEMAHRIYAGVKVRPKELKQFLAVARGLDPGRQKYLARRPEAGDY